MPTLAGKRSASSWIVISLTLLVYGSDRAKELGIEIGMSGHDGVELLLAATKRDTQRFVKA